MTLLRYKAGFPLRFDDKHDGAQGTYLDLTGGGGANPSALYGAGVGVEETNLKLKTT